MDTFVLDLPAMYGDHNVIEVRRILTGLQGVGEVYASSCFHLVEIQYDEAHITPELIRSALDEAGYLGDLLTPMETDITHGGVGANGRFFRHTAALESTGKTIGFSQSIPYAGRPLWPCPGIGAVPRIEEVENG